MILPGMSVAVHITCGHMSKDDYERVIKELEASGASDPDGRQFHAAYGDDDVHMFEVWETPEHFEAHRNDLVSAIQCAGVDTADIVLHSLHSPHPD
jgi:quinol monooxygenase YgiN